MSDNSFITQLVKANQKACNPVRTRYCQEDFYFEKCIMRMKSLQCLQLKMHDGSWCDVQGWGARLDLGPEG